MSKAQRLPELPEGLTVLHCNDWPNLETLPELPAELTVLQCSFTGITELPDLPEGLTELWCNKTPLAKDEKLIDALQKKHPSLTIYAE